MSNIGKGQIELVLKQKVTVHGCWAHSTGDIAVSYQHINKGHLQFWTTCSVGSEAFKESIQWANRIMFLLRLCNRVGKLNYA